MSDKPKIVEMTDFRVFTRLLRKCGHKYEIAVDTEVIYTTGPPKREVQKMVGVDVVTVFGNFYDELTVVFKDGELLEMISHVSAGMPATEKAQKLLELQNPVCKLEGTITLDPETAVVKKTLDPALSKAIDIDVRNKHIGMHSHCRVVNTLSLCTYQDLYDYLMQAFDSSEMLDEDIPMLGHTGPDGEPYFTMAHGWRIHPTLKTYISGKEPEEEGHDA